MGFSEGQLLDGIERINEAPDSLLRNRGRSSLIETRKPDSVSDDHFSSAIITDGIKRPTHNLGRTDLKRLPI